MDHEAVYLYSVGDQSAVYLALAPVLRKDKSGRDVLVIQVPSTVQHVHWIVGQMLRDGPTSFELQDPGGSTYVFSLLTRERVESLSSVDFAQREAVLQLGSTGDMQTKLYTAWVNEGALEHHLKASQAGVPVE